MFLGFDTSNYTTSAALFDSGTMTVRQQKKLLPVPAGARGLRQSECVFHHTVQLPPLVDALGGCGPIDAVCASDRPRMQEGSYMPCFLVGAGAAQITAKALGVPFYSTSHQHGHIAAAAFGAGKLDLLHEPFYAFHVSGGTTEAVLVQPDKDEIFSCTLVAQSLDLKAGQAIDRTGVMLGLQFPCGAQLETLAAQSDRTFRIRPAEGTVTVADAFAFNGAPLSVTERFVGYAAAEVTGPGAARFGAFDVRFDPALKASVHTEPMSPHGTGAATVTLLDIEVPAGAEKFEISFRPSAR